MSRTDAAWVLRLAPVDPVVDVPASAPRTLEQARARLGQGPVDWAVEVGMRMARMVGAEVPELAEDQRSLDTLRMGTESATLRVLLILADPGAHEPITEEALEGDRDFVRRDVALDKVLRGIRISHAILVTALMDGCRALVTPARQPKRMQELSESVFEFVDRFCSRMTEEYLTEHDRWVEGAAAARREMVQAILAGHTPDTESASRTLGYPLRGLHLAATAWLPCPARSAEEAARLHQIVVGLLRRRGCTATLVVPTGGSELWAWGCLAGPAQALPTEHAEVRIAFGVSRSGIAGFRRPHSDALRAAEVIRLAPAGHLTVAEHQQVALVALLGQDLPALREFVADELGPLASDTAQAAQLRATLRHYLLGDRSPTVASARLHVARNTVTYRVNRARDMLGHDISDRRLELQAALEAAHLLGAAVLPSPAAPAGALEPGLTTAR